MRHFEGFGVVRSVRGTSADPDFVGDREKRAARTATGYAWVRFETAAEAAHALTSANGTVIGERYLQARVCSHA